MNLFDIENWFIEYQIVFFFKYKIIFNLEVNTITKVNSLKRN